MVDAADFNPEPGVAIQISKGLRRIVAPNPSPMTFRGTNTYLLGTREVAVIDPGPPDDTHLEAILGALTAEQRISHIFVTHSHIDHSPLAMVLAQITGARVHAFGDSRAGQVPYTQELSDIGGGEGVDQTFLPDVVLKDKEEVAGRGWTLRTLHTPGHMGNHLCYEWLEGNALFSGDLVMGWASSMVSPPDGNLSQFMNSLERLSRRDTIKVYHPGHGAPIPEPLQRVAELAAHRKCREAQIVAMLENGPATPKILTQRIYSDVDHKLWPAAERNIIAHLVDLMQRDIAQADGQFSASSQFSLS